MSDFGFSVAHRLRRRNDFKRVFRHQNKAAAKHVVVLVSRHGFKFRGPGRLGVVVSSKVNKRAVRRHQLKRWVKELFRLELKQQTFGMDVVVLFRRDPPESGHAQIEKEIRQCLPKAIQVADQYQKKQSKRPAS